MEPIGEDEDYAKKQLELYKLQQGLTNLDEYLNNYTQVKDNAALYTIGVDPYTRTAEETLKSDESVGYRWVGGDSSRVTGSSTTPNRDKMDVKGYIKDINLTRKSTLYSPSNNKPQQFTNGYGGKLLDIMSTAYSSDQKMMDAIVKLGEAPEVYKSIVQSLMMELSVIEKSKKLTKKIKIDFGSRN
tara:strand:+ start:1128 stop:1685 length:558 start_codon:yes stop_codon:yes gene_type:complete